MFSRRQGVTVKVEGKKPPIDKPLKKPAAPPAKPGVKNTPPAPRQGVVAAAKQPAANVSKQNSKAHPKKQKAPPKPPAKAKQKGPPRDELPLQTEQQKDDSSRDTSKDPVSIAAVAMAAGRAAAEASPHKRRKSDQVEKVESASQAEAAPDPKPLAKRDANGWQQKQPDPKKSTVGLQQRNNGKKPTQVTNVCKL